MSKTITEFWIPEDGTIGVGSLVWCYHMCTLYGPLHVVELRNAGYGNNSRILYVLFDSSGNEYRSGTFNQLRIPRERVCH